jgi:hypothetical protein
MIGVLTCQWYIATISMNLYILYGLSTTWPNNTTETSGYIYISTTSFPAALKFKSYRQCLVMASLELQAVNKAVGFHLA